MLEVASEVQPPPSPIHSSTNFKGSSSFKVGSGRSGPCQTKFCVSPAMEIPQLLWVTCSVCDPRSEEFFLLVLNETLPCCQQSRSELPVTTRVTPLDGLLNDAFLRRSQSPTYVNDHMSPQLTFTQASPTLAMPGKLLLVQSPSVTRR